MYNNSTAVSEVRNFAFKKQEMGKTPRSEINS